jgi:hypothetical protein
MELKDLIGVASPAIVHIGHRACKPFFICIPPTQPNFRPDSELKNRIYLLSFIIVVCIMRAASTASLQA